jgi:hypothetical protein
MGFFVQQPEPFVSHKSSRKLHCPYSMQFEERQI